MFKLKFLSVQSEEGEEEEEKAKNIKASFRWLKKFAHI